MHLNLRDVQTLCEVAIEAARASGAMIESFSGRTIEARTKDTGSSQASQVVTEVDLKSQEMILAHITPTLSKYELGLLIEESHDDQSQFEHEYFWCIDPLDGTLPFVRRQPGYAVSIALVSRKGDAVMGVIYDPRSATLYQAIRGNGAFRNGTRWNLDVPFEEGQHRVYARPTASEDHHVVRCNI